MLVTTSSMRYGFWPAMAPALGICVANIVWITLAASGVGRGGCTVHLSPADATAAAGIAFRSATRVEPDPDVADGCVQVETPHGLLVRDLNAALASIGARLREEARS